MTGLLRAGIPPAPSRIPPRSAPARLLAGAALMVLAGGALCGLSAQEVTLKGENWTLVVQPQTLAVSGTLVGGQGLSLSSPRPVPALVEGLHAEDRHAWWNLPDEKVAVDMRLDGDELVAEFTASAPGSFSWPLLAPMPGHQAFILPLFEGLYVPAQDAQWAQFLQSQSPFDTTAGLSMPFWGIDCGEFTLTYLVTDPCNNELFFTAAEGGLAARFTHAFTPNQSERHYALRIALGSVSPVEPAKRYRAALIRQGQFISLKEKIAHVPDAAKLLGAAQVYLWGDGLIARGDITDYKRLAARLIPPAGAAPDAVAERLRGLLGSEARTLIAGLPVKEWVDRYDQGVVCEELSRLLALRDFYAPSAWAGTALPAEARDLLGLGCATLSDGQLCRLNCLLLQAAFPDLLAAVDGWGDGLSLKMVQQLAAGGLDRLWLGSPNWSGLRNRPDMVAKAVSLGYLIAPYDSFNGIHRPDQANSWETSQFGSALYDSGAIIKQDGTPRKGFQKKGYMLSPLAARAAVEQRVTALMRQFRCNSWFIDCDAAGELYDDYSPQHPATQLDDMAARLARMAWIRDTFSAVIGSEGGSAYAASTIHFAHGMMTPVIGWGDPALTERSSPFYLGGYYPPDAPAAFFAQVPLKEEYRRIYADPRFRLPLYETVFHDAVVATHQWGYGSLKFADPERTRELLELLYGVPPLYHLNLDEWAKRRTLITAHYAFFSPLHRISGLLPMSDFQWLSEDHLVQRTVFGDDLDLIANFRAEPFTYDGALVPGHSIAARTAGSRVVTVYPSP
jgi:Glycosyl hydrolases related to GH101 family, GH129